MAVGVFEAKAHLWTIFLQIKQLLTVEGSSTLLPNKLDSIFIFHPTFDQSKCHQNRSSAEARHTVDSDAAARLLPKLQLQQIQPVIDDLIGRGSAIVERPVQDLDALLHHQSGIVRGLAHSHDGGDSVLLQLLDELVQRGVGGIVGDQESHVFVGDFHRGGSVHSSHFNDAKVKDNVTKAKCLVQSKKHRCKHLVELGGNVNRNVRWVKFLQASSNGWQESTKRLL